MTEDESKKLIIDVEHQSLIEASGRMIEQTKERIAYLRSHIDNQEKMLAKQRVEMSKLLRNSNVKDD